MSISVTSSYANPFRLIPHGQAGTAVRNTPSASANATPSTANAPETFADTFPSDAPVSTNFEMKSDENTPAAVAARIAAARASIAEKAKTDPKAAYIENLKDQYNEVKVPIESGILRLDGVYYSPDELEQSFGNHFVGYLTAQIDQAVRYLAQYNDSASSSDLGSAKDVLSRLKTWINQYDVKAPADSLTSQYTKFTTGHAIGLNELYDAVGI